MFKELIEQRNIAKEAWDKARKEIQPLADEYWRCLKLIDKKFIEEKVYIPIEKADEFLKGKRLSSVCVVFEDGDFAELYNDYDVYWDSYKQCFDRSSKRWTSRQCELDFDGCCGFVFIYR